MNTRMVASLLLCGLAAGQQAAAQGAGPALQQEVVAVREALVRDNVALRSYTWTENTEVRIKNDVKSSANVICRYDAWHKLERRPLGEANTTETPKATSKRPINRKKADMADYVERAVSLVHTYLPPKPEQLQFLMQTGKASLGQAASGQAQIQFQNYYQDGDSLTFTFDPRSKALLKVAVKSYLVTPWACPLA